MSLPSYVIIIHWDTVPTELRSSSFIETLSVPSYAHHSLRHCPYRVTLITIHWDTVPTELRSSSFIETLSLPSYAHHHTFGHCLYQVTLLTIHWDTVPTKLRSSPCTGILSRPSYADSQFSTHRPICCSSSATASHSVAVLALQLLILLQF
jgi:hypothetical protein